MALILTDFHGFKSVYTSLICVHPVGYFIFIAQTLFNEIIQRGKSVVYFVFCVTSVSN